MPPRAPSFSPALDAPITVGQPGFVGSPEELPRGTDKRVLPPTREPGIWASDGEPKAVQDLTPPRLMGVLLPFPPAPDDPKEGHFARTCASKFNELIDLHRVAQQAARLPAGVRNCIAANLYQRCIAGLLKIHNAAAATGDVYAPAFAADLRAYLPVTAAFVGRMCDGSRWPPEGVDLHDGLSVSFMRSNGVPK